MPIKNFFFNGSGCRSGRRPKNMQILWIWWVGLALLDPDPAEKMNADLGQQLWF
jgi:hypothetical protein